MAKFKAFDTSKNTDVLIRNIIGNIGRALVTGAIVITPADSVLTAR